MSVPVYTRLSTPPSSMDAILITPPELPSRPTANAKAIYKKERLTNINTEQQTVLTSFDKFNAFFFCHSLFEMPEPVNSALTKQMVLSVIYPLLQMVGASTYHQVG